MIENTGFRTDDPAGGAKPMPDEEFKAFDTTISARGLLAITMTITVCVMSALGVEVIEPLYSGWLLSLGFYFGQKLK